MMSSGPKAARLTLRISADQDTDPEELDRITRQLRTEIDELGVESAELARGEPAPAGTKSPEALTLGALVLAVLPETVPRLIDFLQAWLQRGERRKVKIKAQVGNRSVEIEYSPSAMASDELKSLVRDLTGTLAKESKVD